MLKDNRVVDTQDGWLASHLYAVIVVSVEDGLLVKQWSAGSAWGAETVTPFIADVFQRIVSLVRAARGTTGIRALTVEAEEDLILIHEVWPGYVGVFVFPAATKIGMARMEIGRTMPEVRRAIWQLEPTADQ